MDPRGTAEEEEELPRDFHGPNLDKVWETSRREWTWGKYREDMFKPRELQVLAGHLGEDVQRQSELHY